MCKRSNGLVVKAKKDRRDEEDIDVARFHSCFSRSRALFLPVSLSLSLSRSTETIEWGGRAHVAFIRIQIQWRRAAADEIDECDVNENIPMMHF